MLSCLVQLLHRGRQQKAGIAVDRAEVAHAQNFRDSHVIWCPLYPTIPRRVKFRQAASGNATDRYNIIRARTIKYPPRRPSTAVAGGDSLRCRVEPPTALIK